MNILLQWLVNTQTVLELLNWNAKVDASKSDSRCRDVATLASVFDERWVAQQCHSQEPAVDSLVRHARHT